MALAELFVDVFDAFWAGNFLERSEVEEMTATSDNQIAKEVLF